MLKHLNQLTGAKYTTAKSTLQNIRARLVDGHTLEELKLVVEYLVDRWLGTEWAKYLNRKPYSGQVNSRATCWRLQPGMTAGASQSKPVRRR